MKTLAVLGSTGSIGVNTLEVVRCNPERFRVHALAAGENVERLSQQIQEFHPREVVVATDTARVRLMKRLSELGVSCPELSFGPDALIRVGTASEVDAVISAIVGVAGLEATYEAIRAKKRVGLANKEVLVSAGSLVMEAARQSGAELIPVDSEHNGAHQCLRAGNRTEVTRLILTASGGPFRNTPAGEMAKATPAQALNHPTWKMGNRITVDSATLMNKGFEVIEACWLFGFTPAQVDVVIHPQSTVHAMIEMIDGSVLAQISTTDMRMPIQYALTWPDRNAAPVPKLDWSEARTWEFSAPDWQRFPLLKLAYRCQEAGGSSTCVLNAADEVAVEAFLQGRIPFGGIAQVVEETLQRFPSRRPGAIADVLDIDKEARSLARQLLVPVSA